MSVTAFGATSSLCDATASKNDLFAQPQVLNFGKQIHLMYKLNTVLLKSTLKKFTEISLHWIVQSTAMYSASSAYTQKNKQILA